VGTTNAAEESGSTASSDNGPVDSINAANSRKVLCASFAAAQDDKSF
jgi:hypothetical protein